MKSARQWIKESFQIALGVILSSIGLKAFLLPNGFLDGGVTGIAILVNQLFDVNVSIALIIASIPFLILAFKTSTRKIVIKSSIAITALALFIEFENFNPVTEDKLLIAIFGGLFLGAGIGVTIKNGAVLDGSEILGIFINNRFGISIGKVVLLFNIILFSITAFLISVEISMYSILTFLVTAKVIDLMIEGFEDYVGLTIVSNHPDKVRESLIEEVGAGITVYQGSKGYGRKGLKPQGEIIHTVINRIDINRTYRCIEKSDKDAFVVEFDVNNIRGGIMKRYLPK